jgi:thiol-disulfide isomerase/thioredoxin
VPEEVEAAWTKLDDLWEDCRNRVPCWSERVSQARALRERYPENLAAHRYLATLASQVDPDLAKVLPVREELRREYAELSGRYPRNPSYSYLVGLLTLNNKERTKNLRRALELDPAFAWAHHALARDLLIWARRPTQKDSAEARAHLDAFAAACPTRAAEILDLVGRFEDRDTWNTYSARLAASITPEPGRYRQLPTLWARQFKFTPPQQHAALRERMSQEIETLRRLDRPKDMAWLRALRAGYTMLGNESAKHQVEEFLLASFPCTSESTQIRRERLSRDHPDPPEEDESATQAYLKEQIAAMDPWLRSCPDDELLWQIRLHQASYWREAKPEMVQIAADRIVALSGDRGAGWVADAYIEKKMRLEQAARLIETEHRVIEEHWKDAQARGLEGAMLKSHRQAYHSDAFQNRSRLARLALARKDAPAAAEALQQLDRLLAAWQSDGVPELEKYVRAEYWRLRAELAELQERPSEALDAYRNSLERTPDNRNVREAARTVFRRVHGEEKGFAAWLEAAERAARTASDERTVATRKPLPDFRLSDLTGREWTPKDLRGKALLVNFWATWCGPCRQELPWVEKLHSRVDLEGTARVITVSVDDNPGLIEPFLKAEKYRFPVLVGGPGSVEKFVSRGIPQTWIVSPEGLIVQEQLGFAGDGEKWLARMEADLNEAKRSGLATKGSGS